MGIKTEIEWFEWNEENAPDINPRILFVEYSKGYATYHVGIYIKYDNLFVGESEIFKAHDDDIFWAYLPELPDGEK